MLAHQREKIRSLEPLKAKLVTTNEHCSEKILAMRAEEKSEISVLKNEKINLLKLIDKKNEEKVALQTEVNVTSSRLAQSQNFCPLPTQGLLRHRTLVLLSAPLLCSALGLCQQTWQS